jgi:hypothetical protein
MDEEEYEDDDGLFRVRASNVAMDFHLDPEAGPNHAMRGDHKGKTIKQKKVKNVFKTFVFSLKIRC